MSIEVGDVMGDSTHTEPVNALIFLVSPGDNPALHLRVLAKLAGSLEAEGFMEDWLAAATPQRVREVMLRDDRFLSFVVSEGRPSGELAGIGAEQVGLPDGCLVALVNREGQSMLPDDEFSLSPGDRLTIIGEKDGIAELKTRYTHPPGEHAGDSSRCDHQAVEVVELRLESVSPSNDGGGQKSEPARRDSFGP